ncbi:MAG: OmpA family protein [Proteobacteria bacterium]|nr:OmpA family protein [Pseudomonadota bacterium]
MRSRGLLLCTLGLVLGPLLPLSSAHADDTDDEQAKPAEGADDEAPSPPKKKKKSKKPDPATEEPATPTEEGTTDEAPAPPPKKRRKKAPPVTAPADAPSESETPAALSSSTTASTDDEPPRLTLTAAVLGATPLDKSNRDLFGAGGGASLGVEAYLTPMFGIHVNGLFVALTKDGGMSTTTWLGGGIGPRVHLGEVLFGEATHHDAWVDAHVNYGSSGGIRRPGFDLAAAVEWEVAPALRLGPVVRYQFGSDPLDKNAQLFTIGLAVDYGGRTRVAIQHPAVVIADEDGDGVVDASDECPEEAAGKAPDPKRAGCPLPKDGDGDGVVDFDDACPEEAAGATPDPERAGCPAPVVESAEDKIAKVTGNKIEIFQQVYFTTNSATIEDRSDAVLDVVGKIIRNLKGKHVRIEGHTDESGTDAYNLDLSRRRARAVAQWLVKYASIDPSIMVTEGYGKSRPLTSGANSETNRRVEFVILDE